MGDDYQNVISARFFIPENKYPEEEQQLAATYQIRSIPTLMIFREQIIIFAQPGMLPASALEEIIGKAKELDMDYVREEIAKQQAQQDA